MITLNSEKGLILVESWGEIESRPGFIGDLNPGSHKLKSIIGRYVFAEKIRCGLSNCHTPHAKGYIVVTEDGHETNIGKDCGKTYFGVDFEILSRKFDRDLTASENRETLASFSFHVEDIEKRIHDLRTSERGADWVYKNIRPLLTIGRGCPDEVVRKIGAMLRARNALLTVDRVATQTEIESIEAVEGRQLPRPHYIAEPIGQISGFEAMHQENDLRDLLVLGLEQHIRDFREQAIAELSHDDLRRWVKWVHSIENTMERAEAAVVAGQALLLPNNLELLSRVISGQADQSKFRAFLNELAPPQR